MTPMTGAAVRSTDGGDTEYDASAPSSGSATGVEDIEIEPSANGGFIAKCRYPQPDKGPYQKPESHTFASFEELVTFLGEKLGAGKQPEPPTSDVSTEQAGPPAPPPGQ